MLTDEEVDNLYTEIVILRSALLPFVEFFTESFDNTYRNKFGIKMEHFRKAEEVMKRNIPNY